MSDEYSRYPTKTVRGLLIIIISSFIIVRSHLDMVTIIVRMRMLHVLVVMYYVISSPSVYCEQCQGTCQIGRVQGLKFADCFNRDLPRVPQCLPGGIEILDLSRNRIREINEDDLSSYSYLEILYLADNALIEINEHALEYLTSLHTVDLASTSLYKIPSSLFSLPVLRKLLLGGIKNPSMVHDIEEASPVTSPLIYLDLSNDKLWRLPILGEVPTSLQSARIHRYQWLTSRHVKYTPFNCQHFGVECTNEVPIHDLNIFNSCRRLHETQQAQIYKKKLLTNVGISMGTILLFLLIVLYFIVRRHRKQKKKTQEQAQKQRKEAIDDLL
ncbi:hypothetical protein QE152_g10066 [Popillia japonica]|uniref:Uncharacterized protein n=1 Tax=Popillia japonica TaxID=7064 RepID=A0AAW1LWH2_POPJA